MKIKKKCQDAFEIERKDVKNTPQTLSAEGYVFTKMGV